MSALSFNGNVSDSAWQKKLQNNDINAQRKQQARAQSEKNGEDFYTWSGNDGSRGTGSVRADKRNASSYDSNGNFTGGISGSNSSSSSNLGLNSFLNDSTLDGVTNRAKDLAQFRLGLDKDQAGFSAGLRETEAKNNFGRTTSFEDQQQRGRVDLTNITQNALTGRLNSELSNRLTQQQKGFDQSNLQTNRAIGLASKRLGR